MASNSGTSGAAVTKAIWCHLQLALPNRAPKPPARVYIQLTGEKLIAKKAKATAATQDSVDVEEVTVSVTKSGTGLDFSIKGGREHNLPVLISRVFANGAADRTGQVHAGDIILAVNEHNLVDASHDEAVAALKSVGQAAVLKLRHFKRSMPGTTSGSDQTVVGSIGVAASELDRSTKSLNKSDSLTLPDGASLEDVVRISLHRISVSQFTTADGDKCSNLSVFLRASDGGSFGAALHFNTTEEAYEWYQAIYTAAERLSNLFVKTLVKSNAPAPFTGKAVKCGWLSQQITGGKWRWVYVVLTDYDLNVFSGVAPGKSEELQDSQLCLALSDTRLRTMEGQHQYDRRNGCFALISAKGQLYYFSAETVTHCDDWCDAIEIALTTGMGKVDSLKFDAFVNGRPVVFEVCHDSGLRTTDKDGVVLWESKFGDILSSNHESTALHLNLKHLGGITLDMYDPRSAAQSLLNVLYSLANAA